MSCSTSRNRNRRRKSSSKITWSVLLLLRWHQLECFVYSFQAATPAFNYNNCHSKHSRKVAINNNNNNNYNCLFRQHHPFRRDGLSQQFATSADELKLLYEIEREIELEIETEMETENNTQHNNNNNHNSSESSDGKPNYCYVNPPDDVSKPFLSFEYSESTFIEYTNDGLCLPAGPVGQLKEVAANFLTEPSVEILIALVVLLNSLLVALSTLDSLSYFFPLIRIGEIIIGMIFFADFFARWFSSSRDEFGFVLDPQFVLDILVVIIPLAFSIAPDSFWTATLLPTALSQPSGLFNLQLLRVLRLQRFLQDLDTFEKFAERALGRTNVRTYIVQDWQLQLARVVLSLFTLISVSSGLIYTAEHSINPNINNYFDALYFGLTTLTTVGFGDVSPVTWQGRLVVCGSIVFGVAVVPGQAAALVEALLDRENVRKGRAPNSSRSMTNRKVADINGTTKNSNANEKSESSALDADQTVLALDTTMSCYRCGASFHWSCARYCYSCGEEVQKLR